MIQINIKDTADFSQVRTLIQLSNEDDLNLVIFIHKQTLMRTIYA